MTRWRRGPRGVFTPWERAALTAGGILIAAIAVMIWSTRT